MQFRPIPVIWAYVFLSGKSADPNPISGKFHFFFKPSLISAMNPTIEAATLHSQAKIATFPSYIG